MGRLRLIDCLLIDSRAVCVESKSTDRLDLGSDHRAAFATIEFEVNRTWTQTRKQRNCSLTSLGADALKGYTASLDVWASETVGSTLHQVEAAINKASEEHLQTTATTATTPWKSEAALRVKRDRDTERDPARPKAPYWRWRRVLRKE